ncbi:hypothetical protein D5416_25935 [Salmonella enterica]|uniref:Uncharacterized protein n=1 Tax=Salmonella enterica subsp. enterica serovar Heidelberg TaxID=611 RepID=A0A6W0HPN8_SALET|nr:hypothetical protein [Salmonella enterica]HAA0972226.1 hypothetical protein [Salmonella enterica subsp. enterica serovar Heidelberg]
MVNKNRTPFYFYFSAHLSQFDQLLKKLSVEAAFNAEMAHHLGYEKNQPRITGTDNCKYPA